MKSKPASKAFTALVCGVAVVGAGVAEAVLHQRRPR